jgi:hypothetical protein
MKSNNQNEFNFTSKFNDKKSILIKEQLTK